MKYLARVCTGALTLGLLITSGSVAASAHRITYGHRYFHYQPRTEVTYRRPMRRAPLYYPRNNQAWSFRRHHTHHYHIHIYAAKTFVRKPKRIHHTYYKNYNQNSANSSNNVKNGVTLSNSANPNYNNNNNNNNDNNDNNNKDNYYATKFSHSRISKLAQTKLGDPYIYGANGDNAFDCSGFTQYLYRNVKHINLPRTAQAQYDYEKHVSYNHIKPGNLVFFGTSPQAIGHVGMYIGNGKMIDAQLRGVVVEDVQAPWWNLVGCAKVHRNHNYNY